jgi:hypothetical protein
VAGARGAGILTKGLTTLTNLLGLFVRFVVKRGIAARHAAWTQKPFFAVKISRITQFLTITQFFVDGEKLFCYTIP